MTTFPTEQEDTSMSVDTAVETIAFTAHDRCDRCGSQALAVARKEGTADLMFCNHHRHAHEDALLAQGFEVIFDSATYESYRIPVAV